MKKSKLILLPVLAMSLGMLVGCDGQAINNAISGVQSQIDGMQSDINDLKNQVKDLKEQIAKLEGEMNANIAQVTADYKKEIAELEADISSLQKKIDDLTAQLATDKDALETDYNSKINKVKTDYDAELLALKNNYDKQLADLEQDYKDKIDDLKEEYDANLATITANYDAQLEALIANYDNQLNNIRTDYNTKLNNVQATYDTKVAEIEANISSANAQISALQSELALQIAAIQNEYSPKINDLTGRVAELEKVQSHTVTFDTNGAGFIPSVVVIHGEKVSKPNDPSKVGSVFKGWTYKNEPWSFVGYPVTEDMTLVASWEAIDYSVTFQNDDGTVLQRLEKQHYGETVEYTGPTPVKPNPEDHYLYTFSGWDKELKVVGDMVFTAQYDKEYAPFQEVYLDAYGNTLFSRYVAENEDGIVIKQNNQEIISVDGEILFEGEDCAYTGGANVDEGDYYHGGKTIAYFETGCTLTLSFFSSTSFESNLFICIARADGQGRRINEFFDVLINDEKLELPNDLKFEKSNGWQDFELINLGSIEFEGGENQVLIVSKEAVNIDYFIINVNTISLEKYGLSNPAKENEDGLMFSFRCWELASNENNVITYRPLFDTATVGLEFANNVVGIYHGSSKNVVVPAYWNGLKINNIGESSFAGTNVKEVELPNTITSIGNKAFYQCGNLNNINFPSSLKSLGYQSFDSTSSLKYVTFNEGIKTISGRAFEGSGLKEVILPENIDFIGDNAFGGLYADYIYVPSTVKTIEWHCFYSPEGPTPKTNVVYTDKEFRPSTWDPNWALRCEVVWGFKAEIEKDGYKYAIYEVDDAKYAMLIDYDKETIVNFEVPETVNGYTVNKMQVDFRGNEKLERVVLPDYVKSISNNMFEECTSLKYVYIPGSVTSIGELAFHRCYDLETVVLNEGLKTTGWGVFAQCYSLSSITLPESMVTIGAQLFDTCTSLTHVNIPKNVKTIDRAVFRKSSIEFVDFPETIRVIEESMFEDCGSLNAVVFPASLKSIGAYAFAGTPAFSTLYFRGTEEQWNALPPYDGTNNQINGTTKYFYSETEPTTPGNFWRYVEGVPTVW